VEILDFAPDDLRADLAARTHALLYDIWPEDAPNEGDYYRTHGAPTTVVILREAQDVLAHLAIYERQVSLGSETLEIGMLGGIVVAPEQRRRGHCKLLVRHAHERLKSRNIPFSILFAYEPAVYASSGYRLMQNVTRFIDRDGTPKALVFRGGMYAELAGRRWPDQLLDLRGRVV
jgi:predicted acetyltransferase